MCCTSKVELADNLDDDDNPLFSTWTTTKKPMLRGINHINTPYNTLNLFDKLLNAVYDIRYNFLSKTVRDVQGKTPDSSQQLDLRA